ncbi:MAG: hypothetical protein ACM3KM_03320 [Acidobacteriaceae bacterium]
MKIERSYKKSKYLHSPAHVLADEISQKLNDKKHFGFYLKMALTNSPDILRRLAGDVLEQKAKNPGALFAYLIKKNHEQDPKNNHGS